MKSSKVLSIALFTGSIFLSGNAIAQEKQEEDKKPMAEKVEKEKHEDMKVEKSMKADDKPIMVGEAKMFSTRTIVENAAESKEHTTFVEALKAADLTETLSSEGPFTVFAPTNEAFNALPEGKLEELLKPENKEKLQSVLKYHVVPGKYTSKKLAKLIKENNGEATLETASGETLKAWEEDGKIFISDENGSQAELTIADVKQSNGVLHVTNTVVMPKA